MNIPNKSKMYDLFQAGAFGNKTRSWMSYDDYVRDGMPCGVGIRYKDPRGGAGPFVPYLDPGDVPAAMAKLVSQGWRAEYMTFAESTPDERLLMNGEIIEDPATGYALHFSIEKMNMRAALRKSPQWRHGPGVLLLLQSVFSPSSYADMKALLDTYPFAAVEFSAFSHNLGDLSGRNVVVWEVRHY